MEYLLTVCNTCYNTTVLVILLRFFFMYIIGSLWYLVRETSTRGVGTAQRNDKSPLCRTNTASGSWRNYRRPNCLRCINLRGSIDVLFRCPTHDGVPLKIAIWLIREFDRRIYFFPKRIKCSTTL